VNLQSAANAPQLCATAGQKRRAVDPRPRPRPALALLAREETDDGYPTGRLAAEAALYVTWTLVANGSIRY
jgi:hypothetical protein